MAFTAAALLRAMLCHTAAMNVNAFRVKIIAKTDTANASLLKTNTEEVSSQSAKGPVSIPSLWEQKVENIRILGSGSFGVTHKMKVMCAPSLSEQFVAVKVIDTSSLPPEFPISREIGILQSMSGKTPYVNSLVGKPSTITEGQFVYLMLEEMNQGELGDFYGTYKSTKGFVPVILSLFLHVVKGVAALHFMDFVHRDLKPQNLLVNCQPSDLSPIPDPETLNCYAAIIDFGIACRTGSCSDRKGTSGYMSPELLKGEATSLQSNDIWALGNIMHILMFGKPPSFWDEEASDASLQEATLKYLGGKSDEFLLGVQETGSLAQKSAASLIAEMLNKDYSERPSAREVLDKLLPIIDLALDEDSTYARAVTMMKDKSPLETHAKPLLPECIAGGMINRINCEDETVEYVWETLEENIQDKIVPLLEPVLKAFGTESDANLPEADTLVEDRLGNAVNLQTDFPPEKNRFPLKVKMAWWCSDKDTRLHFCRCL